MWVRACVGLAVAFVAVTVVAQEPAKPEPAKPGGTWEVKYIDDSTMKLTLLDESLTLTTPHGSLQIPVRDIRKIEFGSRLSDVDQKAVDGAIADLGSTETPKREAAKKLLLEIGVKALPAVNRAAGKLTGAAKAEFTQVADALTMRLPNRRALPRDTDVIYTDESVIAGRIGTSTLRVQTFQFGEQKLKVTDVTVMQFGKLAAVARNENLEIINANLLTQVALQRVGQTVGVQVTGAIGGSVWGTGVYTSDSSLATAAVHAGALKVGESGVVKIRFVQSPPNYVGSNQNGVASSDYGPFTSGSYEIIRTP